MTTRVRPTDAPDTDDAARLIETDAQDGSVHDTLLETVSVEALQSRDGASHDAPDQESGIDEPTEAAAEPAGERPPVPTVDSPRAEAANDAEPSDARAAETLPVEAPPAPIVVPSRPATAPAFRRASALDALNELSRTNDTVVAFLRNEGRATVAHWRSLAKAKSPADAVRLQVDEMQRAADASLTCINTLARRAGRLAGLIGRR